jgi:hypothetical protein
MVEVINVLSFLDSCLVVIELFLGLDQVIDVVWIVLFYFAHVDGSGFFTDIDLADFSVGDYGVLGPTSVTVIDFVVTVTEGGRDQFCQTSDTVEYCCSCGSSDQCAFDIVFNSFAHFALLVAALLLFKDS